MVKSTLMQGVRTLKRWYEVGTLLDDNPIQRKAGQWTNLQKSLLIHSILGGYIIPPVYFYKEKIENKNCYDIAEGKQRLTTVFEFIDNGFELNGATPEVEYDGFTYDLAGYFFNDLPDELQDAILGFRFNITCVEECTPEQKEEIFVRINNSTPLSPMQKNYSKMGVDTARWLKTVISSHFFEQAVNLTVAQLRKEADAEVLAQAMLLIEARDCDYEYKAISAAEVGKFSEYLRKNYTQEKMEHIEEIVDYLNQAFLSTHKFLKKSNVPMVIVLVELALEQEIEPKKFKNFIDYFNGGVFADYEENTGSGNTKYSKVTGRLDAICRAFVEYFDIEEFTPLTDEYYKVSNVDENVEVDSEEASSLEGVESESENSGDFVDSESILEEEDAEEISEEDFEEEAEDIDSEDGVEDSEDIDSEDGVEDSEDIDSEDEIEEDSEDINSEEDPDNIEEEENFDGND